MQVLIKMKVSTICGSDIRCIYREHLGKGPEGYQGCVAGHEPCGQIVVEGPGLRRFKKGDRVIVYHISGCGMCNDCRRGFMISCTSAKFRRAYGWQRHGGMAEYILAEEKARAHAAHTTKRALNNAASQPPPVFRIIGLQDLVLLPEELSYADGAMVACGFGTVYEGLAKIGVSGDDAVLVTGLGPVGLAACMLCKALGANKVIGIDATEERIQVRWAQICIW